MKQQDKEELPEHIEVVTPGVLLKEARVSLQLTPDDIGKRLNLKAKLIEDIEANEFDEMPSITFARGYLKAYAKLVHVNESDVLEAFEYLSTAEQQQHEMQSFSHRSSQRALDNWLSILSYLIVTIILVLAVVWWLQRNDDEAVDNTADRDAATAVVIEKDDPPQKSPLAVDSDTVKPISDAPPISPIDSQADNIADSRADDVADNPLDSSVEQSVEQVADNTLATDAPDNDADAVPAAIVVADQLTDVTTDAANSNNDTVAVTPEADLTHLELRFSDSCWINIEDARGERIAIGTKNKGHLTSVYGVAPFTIKLGKPDAVTIWLEGVQQSIPYYPKGSIANFELSLN